MREYRVSFETAKRASDKGFNVPGNVYFDTHGVVHSSRQRLTTKSLKSGGYLRPTMSLLQKWLRKKRGIFCWVEYDGEKWHSRVSFGAYSIDDNFTFDSYSEALDTALRFGLIFSDKHIETKEDENI